MSIPADGDARELGLKPLAKIRAMGPAHVVIKKGEHGALLFGENRFFSCGAYPLEDIHDPTGAGDSFAGGFMGHLARSGDLADGGLRRALVYGSVMASFAVEEFGLGRLLRLTPEDIETRFNEFKSMTHFDV